MSTLDRPKRVSAAGVEARINGYSSDSSLSLEDSSDEAPTKEHRVARSEGLRIKARKCLQDCIKSAIGRDIVPRGLKPVDPRRNDLEPPNLYKWTFTEKYPCFPNRSTSKWTTTECEACLYALDQGWLLVLALPTQANDGYSISNGQLDMNDDSDDQRRLNSANDGTLKEASKQDIIDQSIKLVEERIEAGDAISSLRESCSKVDHLIFEEEAAHRKASELLEMHRKHVFGIKDKIFEFAKSKNSLLEDAVKNQNLRYQELKSSFEELEEEYNKVSGENLSLMQRLERQIDDTEQERRLGEIEELYTEIQCLRDDSAVTFHSHLAQIIKAKQEGFRKGEAYALSKSAALIADLKRQLEENQANHAIEKKKAREDGRREDELLNQLLEGHNLHYEGRKRREIRTIYGIWKNIPQNILPKLMLPDGVMLEDGTLILLAKLSRAEHDPHKAVAMLQRVVERRNCRLAVACKDSMITDVDIEKVLSNLGDVESGQRNSEMSSASQTEVFHDMWGVHNLSPCPVESHQAKISTCCFEEVSETQVTELSLIQFTEISSATPFSQVENDNSTNPAELRRSSIPHQRLLKPLHQRGTTETKKNTSMDKFTQAPVLDSQGRMATDQTDATSTSNHTIEEEINALCDPHKSLIPSSLQHFPMAFLKDFVGGDGYTFAKCGRTLLNKQLVAWPEMIKLNPEYHPLCPTQGRNGALTFVAGRRNMGEIGKIYPTLLREKVNFYKYIGHYKVVKHIKMPVATWKSYRLEERLGIAEEIEAKEWGQTLLTQKGLCVNATDTGNKRLSDILGFFEKPQEPCLRMSWTLLQFMSFQLEDYNLLLDASKQREMEQDSEKVPEEDSEDDFANCASPTGPEMRSRFLNFQSLGQDHHDDSIKFWDGLPSPVSRFRNNAKQWSHNTIQSNKASNRHNKGSASRVAKSDLAAASEVNSCGQVTSASNTSISDAGEFPEFPARSGDCRWHTHATKDLPVNPTLKSVTKQQAAGKHTDGLNAGRLVEEDIYEVSPPRRATGDALRTRPSIFSRYAKDTKRKYSEYVEDAEDNSP